MRRKPHLIRLKCIQIKISVQASYFEPAAQLHTFAGCQNLKSCYFLWFLPVDGIGDVGDRLDAEEVMFLRRVDDGVRSFASMDAQA